MQFEHVNRYGNTFWKPVGESAEVHALCSLAGKQREKAQFTWSQMQTIKQITKVEQVFRREDGTLVPLNQD